MVESSKLLFKESPEELIYQMAYAPASVEKLLDTADGRGRIRRLTVPHLFFEIREFEDTQIQQLLPHITEEQWTGVLDLDLWSRDIVDTTAFISWARYIVKAEDAVARKLVRAIDPELWELTFKREFQIHVGIDENEFDTDLSPQGGLKTPDGHFLIGLPLDSDKAQLTQSLILRLYELDPNYSAFLLNACCEQTAVEIEEGAYQNKKRRVEDLGFQDYFDAIGIYTYRPEKWVLPKKKETPLRTISSQQLEPGAQDTEGLLLFQALGLIEQPLDRQILLEELLFIGNKIASADCVFPAEVDLVKKAIRKAISGINLGLECWSGGDLQKAADGLIRHYLQSLFQVAYSRLMDLRRSVDILISAGFQAEPGSFGEIFLESLIQDYPLLVELKEGKIHTRFFSTCGDLERAEQHLGKIRHTYQIL